MKYKVTMVHAKVGVSLDGGTTRNNLITIAVQRRKALGMNKAEYDDHIKNSIMLLYTNKAGKELT